MNYLNIDIQKSFRSPEWIGSEPVDRATWSALLAFCCLQENGGWILDCKGWGERRWMQSACITKAEVERVSDLWKWDGDDIQVFAYPRDKEREILQKRKAGRKTARKRWGNPQKENSSATSSPSCSVHAEGKEVREGNGSKESPISPSAPDSSLPLAEGEGSKGFTDGTGSNSKRLPTTEQAKRVADIFHRRHNTPWTPKEITAYKALGIIPAEDLAAVEAYYAAQWPPARETNILRHDLQTFLNNFPGEVGRAHNWQGQAAAGAAPAAKSDAEPERWREYLESINRDFLPWWKAMPHLKDDYHKWEESA